MLTENYDPPEELTAWDRAEISRVVAGVSRMYTTFDATLVNELYASDTSVFDVGDRGNEAWVIGIGPWRAIMDDYAKREGVFAGVVDWQHTWVDPIVFGNSELATFSARADGRFTDQTALTHEMDTRYTLILAKTRGKWEVWHEHVSLLDSRPPLNTAQLAIVAEQRK